VKKKHQLPARRDPRQLGLALPPLPGNLTGTGWQQLGRLTMAEAREVALVFGNYLRLAGSAFQWAFADLANAIEDSLGEPGWQAITELAEAAGYTEPTATNVMRIGKAFPFARRRKALTFGHHAAVLSLEDESEQKTWLDTSDKKGWTRAELRQAMKDAGVITGRSGPAEGQPDSSEAWTRIRKALDVVKGAKVKIATVPEDGTLPKSDVTALLDELEGMLYVAPVEPPAEPKKKPRRRKKT
jgi:hypothetical protein